MYKYQGGIVVVSIEVNELEDELELVPKRPNYGTRLSSQHGTW
jgi:hypothetical protein